MTRLFNGVSCTGMIMRDCYLVVLVGIWCAGTIFFARSFFSKTQQRFVNRDAALQCLQSNTANAYLRQLDDFELRLQEVEDFLAKPHPSSLLQQNVVTMTVKDK